MDINKYSVMDLRKHIIYMAKKPFFLQGTIMDNLKLGQNEISDLEVIDACKKVGIHNDIQNLEKGYYVLEKDGKIVCQATTSRIMKYGKCVSAVYTPPEERGKGYAYNLIYRISKELLDSGDKYCVLYTDDSNPISNHVYEKIGYKRKSDWE